MGGNSQSVMQKVLSSLRDDEQVDDAVLRKCFDQYDANNSGVLENGDEITKFIHDLFSFVIGKTSPDQSHTVEYAEGDAEPHQPGCEGIDAAPEQHLIVGRCIVSVDANDPEGEETFKAQLMADLDANNDGHIVWEEFHAGILEVFEGVLAKNEHA